MRRYPFVVLEGCDGAGKTTIRRLLVDAVRRRGVGCFEVGQHSWLLPDVARTIVEVREQRGKYSNDEIAEAYCRDKEEHARCNIIPALARSWVIADRYIYSDAVYLEALYGRPAADTLRRYGNIFEPNCILFVSARTETLVARIEGRGKRVRHYERAPELTSIQAGYERLFLRGEAGVRVAPPVVSYFNDGTPLDAQVAERVLDSLIAAMDGQAQPALV